LHPANRVASSMKIAIFFVIYRVIDFINIIIDAKV
jgi:hypothetical protein